MNHKQLKQAQLGMNPSTAANKLLKDILWSFIVKNNQNFCHRCSLEMDRESFSIEHITPWLHSEDPLKLFFDISNISFSHLICNIKDGRKRPKNKDKDTPEYKNEYYKQYKLKQTPEERKNKRKQQYIRTGK